MRWKLVIIASLLATIVGAGSTLAVAFGLFHQTGSLTHPNNFIIATLLIPIAVITYASIFVYRHTARRRPLQAMLTALLAVTLTLAVLIASAMLSNKQARPTTPPPRPSNIG